MERKLKERITGAALLVVASVVLIPWLLDGRVDPARSEQGLVIPAPGGAPSGVRTIVLNTDRETTAPVGMSAPTPTAARPPSATMPVEIPARSVARKEPPAPQRASSSVEPSAATPREKTRATAPPAPEPVVVASAPAPARTVKPDPAVGWAVQVGSFASEANARKLANQLVALEYRAFVSRSVLEGTPMYRVRVGPRPTREEAAALAERLKADRQPVRVVEHPG